MNSGAGHGRGDIVSRTPFASTRPICSPWRVKATGWRSTTETRIWSGSTRITVACSTQGICFELLAALADGDEENVAADVFAEDGQHLCAAHFGEPGGLDVFRPGDTEARVALQVVAHHQRERGKGAEHDQRAGGKKDAACPALRPPPAPLLLAKAIGGGAQHAVAVRIVELERHARSAPARRAGRKCAGRDESSRVRRARISAGGSSSHKVGRFVLSRFATPEQGRESRQISL